MATITMRDGTEIYFKDWGKGRPVVFSHGWPLSSDPWDDQPIGAAALLAAKSVENAGLEIYEGAPHGLTATHEKRVNEDLLSFLHA